MEEIISRFIEHLRQKGASVNTLSAYQADLIQLRTFLASKGLNGNQPKLGDIDKDLLLGYLDELRRRNYANATVARKVAAIKTFFGFLTEEGILRQNPTESLISPRVGKSLPKPLSVHEMDELLEQPARRNTPEAKRDRAMMELLYATGMRVSELVSLDLEDVSLDPSGLSVQCCRKFIRGVYGVYRQKPIVERTVPIHKRAAEAVEEYLKEWRSKLLKGKEEPALFVNYRGERLTRQGLWLILQNYAHEAQIETPVTPHTLRCSFAAHMLQSGAPLRLVQEFMGHAYISTTQVYEKLESEWKRRVYEKAHPRAG